MSLTHSFVAPLYKITLHQILTWWEVVKRERINTTSLPLP